MGDETVNENPAEETIRTETFATDGPLEIDINVTIGRVEVHLGAGDSAGDSTGEAHVELRRDTSGQPPWVDGMTNMLSWVTERFGTQFGSGWDISQVIGQVDVIEQTRIEKVGNRLVVHAPKGAPTRGFPLSVVVRAPAGSQLEVRAGSADVTVTGAAGRTTIATGSGDVCLDRADGSATVRTGSGDIKLGPALSGLELRTGTGDVEAASLAGSATLVTGTGDIWLGAVAGEVMARSGSGDVAVAEAASGSLELITGSGDVRVGVRSGTAAEIDLSSGAGKVSSELDVAESAPDGAVVLTVRARTGSGNAVVTTAML